MGEWDAPHLAPCDDDIMPYIDMCNIACGGHAGSEEIIKQTIISAKRNNVQIGAHPGFDDRVNFGRKYIQLTKDDLYSLLRRQLELFLSVCTKLEVHPFHIKAHGALYHACNQQKLESKILIDTVKEISPNLTILVVSGSKLEEVAKQEGLSTLTESFIDRRYNDDLTLYSRIEPDAIITDPIAAKTQYDLLSTGKIMTKSGTVKRLLSKTSCIHGDNPHCVQILKTIRKDV